jgi:hypothetical protein
MRRALLVVGVLSGLALAKEPATQAELDALAARAAYAELLERAEDVSAGSRLDPWRSVVTKAAVAVVSHRSAGAPFVDAAKAETLRERYRFLADQPAFITARDEAVVAGAEACVKETEDAPCWKTLASFEKTLGAGGSLALGKLLQKSGFRAGRVMPVFARTVTSKDAPACRDPDVQAVTVDALELPVAEAATARSVAFELCWTAMMPKLKAAMVGASSYRLQNACKAMREKKALTEMQADLCTDEGQ